MAGAVGEVHRRISVHYRRTRVVILAVEVEVEIEIKGPKDETTQGVETTATRGPFMRLGTPLMQVKRQTQKVLTIATFINPASIQTPRVEHRARAINITLTTPLKEANEFILQKKRIQTNLIKQEIVTNVANRVIGPESAGLANLQGKYLISKETPMKNLAIP